MAVGTREFLSRVMVCVTERVAVGSRVGARGPVGFLIVANAARRHLASRVGFAGRRVARVATVMCRKVCRNRQTRTSIHRRAVTARATSLRAS